MKKKIVSIVAACVAICTAAGCSGGTQGAETTTTAAQTEAATTTTAGTEATTTTTPKETTGDAASTDDTAIFTKGVWAASKDGKVDTYFVFYDEMNGTTLKADGMGGTPFTCEQNGLNVLFHFGSADDNTPAVFKAGDAEGTFDYGDGNTVTYSFEYLPDADPDTFEVPEGVNFEGTAIFTKGVWAASKDGSVDTYFVFYDEANGTTMKADGMGGTPFTCEQDGLNITFHFGSADDNTTAVFKEGDAEGTFDYGDGNTVTYSFEYLPDADPDTFEVTPANQ